MRTLHRSFAPVAVAGLLAVGTGCAAQRQSSGFANAMAPSPPPSFLSAQNPLPERGSAWNPEARADHLIGSIAGSIGVVQHRVDDARAQRDVVKLSCLYADLTQLFAIERRARDLRSNVRTAAIEDESDTSAYDELVSAESNARNLRASAEQCVGEQVAQLESTGDHDADGIPDNADVEPDEYSVRVRGLDQRVSDLKDTVMRSKTRMALLGDTVLAGQASTPPVSSPTPKAPTAPPPPPSATTTQDAHDNSMLIRTAELSLAVYEVDKNLAVVEKSALELGGYLALRSDREITVRVPRDKFDELVSRVERMGDVLHKNIAAEDVTDQYVDIDMRLKNALAVRARLEKLLETAAVHDAVEIHRELAKVTEEIERYEGKLKLLRDRIAYSTITVSFEQTQTQQVRSQALLPFPWMNTMGLSPLLRVPR